VRTGSGLARRMLIASCLLSVIVVGTLAMLYATVAGQRDAARMASRSETARGSANHLERLVVDLETSQRGLIITGDRRYLGPWNVSRASIPSEIAELRTAADASGPGQARRAAELARAATSYLNDYSAPLVADAQRDPAAVRASHRTEEGDRRMAGLRTRFDRFVTAQRKIVAAQSARADAAAARAVAVAVGGTAAWLLLILLFAAYMSRVIVRPVRRAAGMADALAGGDPSVRMPETAPAEVGVLERAFNTMADTLEENRAGLQRNAEEQEALRRVATLVARGVPPDEVFNAVAREMGSLLGLTHAGTLRFDPDNMFTVVGSWGLAGPRDPMVPIGSRWSLEGDSCSSRVARTGRPSRIDYYPTVDSDIGRWSYGKGLTCGVGSPIVVDQRVWGLMVGLSTSEDPLPEGIENRMLDFTELIGMAIANTESREELRASRARVVTASDETRRRIERNLHDGTQQHLISLGLELRAVEEAVPDAPTRQRIADSARRLNEIVEDLQEISRGLHPAILSHAGLEPALRALRRRSGVPMELGLSLPRRLPEPIEVAVYYTVSEAVTNAAKHAGASSVRVGVEAREKTVCLSVSDDGVGGAGPGEGSGLLGIRDRVEALGGRIQITSPAGEGTSLRAEIPINR
jgi:signal transduction histidine kinase